jgi:hypothetical protein
MFEAKEVENWFSKRSNEVWSVDGTERKPQLLMSDLVPFGVNCNFLINTSNLG